MQESNRVALSTGSSLLESSASWFICFPYSLLKKSRHLSYRNSQILNFDYLNSMLSLSLVPRDSFELISGSRDSIKLKFDFFFPANKHF